MRKRRRVCMSFDLAHLWATTNIFARLIAGILIVFGLVTITLLFERLITFVRTVHNSRQFGRKVLPLLQQAEYGRALELAEATKSSHLAVLVAATLKAYTHPHSNLSSIAHAKREVERSIEEIAAELRRGFGMLATIGSTAPFVGLLGTVVGIISAFEGIAAAGGGGLSAVSAGIAEALIETALGLVVAIPAVFVFNLLSARADTIEASLRQAGGRLIDTLEDHHHGDLRQSRAA